MEDTRFKKIVAFNYYGQSIKFRVSQDLFSSHQVDVGTRFLLKTIGDQEFYAAHKILDLGCGYGPIGLSLKKVDEERTVHVVDRDALAVEYSRQNAELNKVPDVQVYGSLGYDDVSARDFDLIVSNIPGKAGESAISHFLREAVHYLRRRGVVAIVVIAPLESTVAKILQTPDIHVLLQETRRGYAVFHYRFSDQASSTPPSSEHDTERGIYYRGSMTASLGDIEFPMQTARGLPEFDTLDYRTRLLMNNVPGFQDASPRRILAFNTGQGHVPVALWKLFKPGNIVLVDRDLLALRYSRRNLVLNGCPDDCVALSHQVGIHLKEQESFDLIVGILRETEGQEAIALLVEQAAEQLLPEGTVIITASSTAVTRLVKFLQSEKRFRIKKRKRSHGKSLLVLKRR